MNLKTRVVMGEIRSKNPVEVQAVPSEFPDPGPQRNEVTTGGESVPALSAERTARAVRAALPPGGLFAGMRWRIAPASFPLDRALASDLERLGRVLLQFNRAVNLLYRQSVAGKQPAWVAEWLDRGKPSEMIAWQRHPSFKNDLPRVIRPDLLLTDDGFVITELDSVPGGIGLTAWLNRTYAALESAGASGCGQPDPGASGGAPTGGLGREGRISSEHARSAGILGGPRGMIDGFASIFGDAPRVHIVVSQEAATYRPEMEWLAGELEGAEGGVQSGESGEREVEYRVRDAEFDGVLPGDAVYRFFELFDLENVRAARGLFELALARRIRLTPPPKPIFEEKMLFALLWNRNLRGFWRQELGEGFLERLLACVPVTWVMDPAPLPPHAALPGLDLTDWQQLKGLSQRERDLVLKVSGYSDQAWGARSVALGSDLSAGDWSAAVDDALRSFARSPYVLQRYHKPRTVAAAWFDFERGQTVPMAGRARLCPYYFVAGEGEAARARLGGVLATLCPADKKIIHGMQEAVLAPCRVGDD